MKHTTKRSKEQAILEQETYDHSLWKRLKSEELNENQLNFISQCMTENLEHARHVENERLTFNSIFLALAAGALAFAGTFSSLIAFCIYFSLTMAGFLSMILTARWNNAFGRHLYYAQQCYKILHINLFGDGNVLDDKMDSAEAIKGLNEIPLYSFRIHKPIAYTKLGELMYKPRTKNLYIAFYWIIQILLIGCTVLELHKML